MQTRSWIIKGQLRAMFNMKLGQRYRNGGQTSSQAGSFSESLRLVFCIAYSELQRTARWEHDYQVDRSKNPSSFHARQARRSWTRRRRRRSCQPGQATSERTGSAFAKLEYWNVVRLSGITQMTIETQHFAFQFLVDWIRGHVTK